MGSMDKEGRKAKGFTVLELVVAIFLIAIVIGTVLLIMSANLNIIDKANDILVANALAQYTIEDVKNIEFPPIYYDRQASFGDRPLKDSTTYKTPDEVEPTTDGNDWTPKEMQEKYIVRRYNFRYDGSNSFLSDATQSDTERTMSHRIDVYVLRKRDKALILNDYILISRDGWQ
ncbi:MAG: type II secretion system GspH family protein [Candidatus Omnitrophica bacterium]|nr:type II secretion system GspH family protein [Candidatus Omnitrophota bacterium]